MFIRDGSGAVGSEASNADSSSASSKANLTPATASKLRCAKSMRNGARSMVETVLTNANDPAGTCPHQINHRPRRSEAEPR
jgi:hypothetical protein